MGIIEAIAIWAAVIAVFSKCLGKVLESVDRRAEAQAHERLREAANC